MLTLVIGGASSGKSAYAEELLGRVQGEKLYIATMLPVDEECRLRIARHRERRAGQGWRTLECAATLLEAPIPSGMPILLECVSTLLSNELYTPGGAGEGAPVAIVEGVTRLVRRSGNVVVVTGEVFSDGGRYDAETQRYLRLLGETNRFLVSIAQRAVEVVCGIPLSIRGTGVSGV